MAVVAISAAASIAGEYVAGVVGTSIIGAIAGIATTSLVYSGLTHAFGLDKKAKSVSQDFSTGGNDVMIRSSVANRNIIYGETITSGPLVFGALSGSDNQYLHIVIALAGHQVYSIDSVYFGDYEITSAMLDGSGNVIAGRYADYARIKKHLGSPTQSADSDLVSEVTEWTVDHKLENVAYIYVRLKYNQNKFPQGLPNIKAVVKGKEVYDPRTTSYAWSDNWALCVRDYLTSSYGLGATATEIDDTSFISAANTSDELVILPDTTTQARYTCNGMIDMGITPATVLENLSTAGAGAVVYSQGTYKCYAGTYTTPVMSLNESNLRDTIKVRPRISRQDLFNAVRGTYLSRDNNWQETDFPSVTNSTYETQDGGEQIFKDITLPFTDNTYTAQRIAKIHLEKSRQGITIDFPANYSALKLSPFDNVYISIDKFGWINKVFKVINWQISSSGGVDLVLQEEASSCYTWSSGDATVVDTAPDTTLPDPFTTLNPTDLLYTEDKFRVYGSGKLSWTAPADTYVVEYRVIVTDSNSVIVVDTVVNGTTSIVFNLEAGDYTTTVYAKNIAQVYSSGESLDFTVTVQSLPPRITGLELDLGSEYGAANGTIFTGSDAKIKWRAASTTEYYELGQEPYGADSGFVDWYIKDYQVEVYDPSNNLLRREFVTDTFYVYTWEKNAEDYIKINSISGANREVTFKVWARGRQNQLSESPAIL